MEDPGKAQDNKLPALGQNIDLVDEVAGGRYSQKGDHIVLAGVLKAEADTCDFLIAVEEVANEGMLRTIEEIGSDLTPALEGGMGHYGERFAEVEVKNCRQNLQAVSDEML